MKPGRLPDTSFVGLVTRRLRNPCLVWRSRLHPAPADEQEWLSCCPISQEPEESYLDERHEALVDLYGGSMLGSAGGSGRSATVGPLQLKGVGPTAAIAHDAGGFHSSGTLPLEEACFEAIFSEAFALALPFGVVPVQSIWRTGTTYPESGSFGRRQRVLLVRPFAVRPAHFLRNVSYLPGQKPAGMSAPGWTLDAHRTRTALSTLAGHFRNLLGMPADHGPETATDPNILDAGLRMIARRYATQCAAAFAKRLSHGSLTCSNLALDGRFIDFGTSSHVPRYERIARSAHWTDFWTEARAPISTVLALRRHLVRYLDLPAGTALIDDTELVHLFDACLTDRLSIEMARMIGFSEDQVTLCPAPDLHRLLRVLHEVWSRGATEAFVTFSGRGVDGGPGPAPKSHGRYDLSAWLTLAADSHGVPDTCSLLAPQVHDRALLERFANAYWDVRRAITEECEAPPEALHAYLVRQAHRKNADLRGLNNAGIIRRLQQIEREDPNGAAEVIDEALVAARWILPDLDPSLPGRSGTSQVAEMARRIRSAATSNL